MSTSLLYHGFGVRGYRYVRTEYIRGGIVMTIERRAEMCRCVVCDSENVWRQGVVVRRFRTLPIGGKRIELEARIPRLACQDCGAVRQAAIGFARPAKICLIISSLFMARLRAFRNRMSEKAREVHCIPIR